jgi:hypothetical protein
MHKLNYDTLQRLSRSKREHLELIGLDAVRLHDDRSEIRSGDEVAFVATAKLRLTRDGIAHARAELPEYKPLLQELADGDDLLAIRDDAELESPLPIDPESVKKWLADHYDFAFLLDGDECHQFRTIGRPDTAVPWARTLNTDLVRGDYFDVGVRIEPKPIAPPAPGAPPSRTTVAARAHVAVELDDACLALGLAIEAPCAAVHELQGKTFWIPLHPEHDNVRLVVTVREVTPRADGKRDEPPRPRPNDRNR